MATATAGVRGRRHHGPELVFWGAYGLAVVALAALAQVAAPGSRHADERQYWEIARNLTHGQGYSFEGRPTAFRPPVWVFALAPVAALTSAITAGALVSVAALGGAGVVAAALVERLTGSR